MSADIVKHQGALPAHFQPQVLSAQMDYARALAESNLLPKQYFKQPANLLWAISYGQTLGVDPMTAVQSIHVINGKPTASADLIAGLVRRAGHKLRITGDDRKAVAQIIRADDPDFTFEVVWTIERAHAAKLTNKDTWKQFPAAMLKARAITEVARAACSEILQGTIYTPEELGAVVDQDGNPVDAPVQPLRSVLHEDTQSGMVRVGNVVIDRESFQPYAPAQEIAKKAAEATSRAALTALRDEAQQADVSPDAGILAPDTNAPDTLREYLARRWTVLPNPPKQDDGVTDAEVVAEGETEADQAERELRAAAANAGLDNLDEEFERSYGLPISEAGAQQLREMTRLLTGNAA
jgi:hypothetical protein